MAVCKSGVNIWNRSAYFPPISRSSAFLAVAAGSGADWAARRPEKTHNRHGSFTLLSYSDYRCTDIIEAEFKKERNFDMAEYAHPESLVTTEWVATHAGDPKVVVAEVDVDTKAYDEGHVPGAIAWAWNTQLCDTVVRDILPKAQFEALMTQSGIGEDTTVVLYGDNNNWFAAWAFWQMKIYGHQDVRIMNGGRKKWLSEQRDLDTAPTVAGPSAQPYRAKDADLSLRAFLPQVQQAMKTRSAILIDVRSPQEFSGEILAPPGLPETCQRGG